MSQILALKFSTDDGSIGLDANDKPYTIAPKDRVARPIQGFVTTCERREWVDKKPVDHGVKNHAIVTTPYDITFEHPEHGFKFDVAKYADELDALFTAKVLRSGSNEKGTWSMSEPVTVDGWRIMLCTFHRPGAVRPNQMYQAEPASNVLPSTTKVPRRP